MHKPPALALRTRETVHMHVTVAEGKRKEIASNTLCAVLPGCREDCVPERGESGPNLLWNQEARARKMTFQLLMGSTQVCVRGQKRVLSAAAGKCGGADGHRNRRAVEWTARRISLKKVEAIERYHTYAQPRA